MLKLVFLDTPVRAVTFLPHPRLPIPDVFVYSPLPVSKRAPPPQAPVGIKGGYTRREAHQAPVSLTSTYPGQEASPPLPVFGTGTLGPPHVYDGRFFHSTWNTPVAFHSCRRPPYSVG